MTAPDPAARGDPLLGGPPIARRFGSINLRGLATFYRREFVRGMKIWSLTLAAPALRAILFASVFGLAIDRPGMTMSGMPFLEFLVPGLIVVAALERAFESSAFSMVYEKTEGIFSDMAALPLTPGEIVIAYAAATVTGSVLVSAIVWAALFPIGGTLPVSPLALLFFIAAGSLMVGLFSQISGLWARKWDYIISVQTFVFMPFVFLSGVFFSLDELSEGARFYAQFNPVFYIVDGVRYALTGQAEADPWLGAAVCLAVVAVLWAIAYRLFAIGYRYKS